MTNKMIIFLLFSLTSLFALDKPSNSLFEKGNTLYNKGDYQNAIESYLGIIENGYHSSEVYYNLGNAYYRLNLIGQSIWSYMQASRLDPRNGPIPKGGLLLRSYTIGCPSFKLCLLKKVILSLVLSTPPKF